MSKYTEGLPEGFFVQEEILKKGPVLALYYNGPFFREIKECGGTLPKGRATANYRGFISLENWSQEIHSWLEKSVLCTLKQVYSIQ